MDIFNTSSSRLLFDSCYSSARTAASRFSRSDFKRFLDNIHYALFCNYANTNIAQKHRRSRAEESFVAEGERQPNYSIANSLTLKGKFIWQASLAYLEQLSAVIRFSNSNIVIGMMVSGNLTVCEIVQKYLFSIKGVSNEQHQVVHFYLFSLMNTCLFYR